MQDLLTKCINKGNELIKSNIDLLDTQTENYFSDIILYLIRLYKITKDLPYLHKAEEMGIGLSNFINSTPTINYGFYQGRMKSYFALLKLYEINEDKKYLESISSLNSEDILNFLNYNHAFNNFYKGKSGTLISLLHLYKISKEELILNYIKLYIEKILDSICINEEGIYWDYSYDIIKGLCSLGKGNSGIGLVLLEVGNFFEIEELKELAELAFDYEDSHWDEKQSNWPDFRVNIEKEKFKKENISYSFNNYSYENGISGIGLARLRAYELTKKEKYLKLIENIYRKLVYSYDEIPIEDLIDVTFFCIQVGKSLKDSKYNELAKKFIDKIQLNINLDNISVNEILLQFINPSLESHLYPIIDKTDFTESLDINNNSIKEKFLKSGFSITSSILEKEYSTELNDLYETNVLNSIFNAIEEVVEKINNDCVKEVFLFEKTKLTLTKNIKNIHGIFIKEVIQREHTQHLFNLEEDDFINEYLYLNPNIIVMETKWDWWTKIDLKTNENIDLTQNFRKEPTKNQVLLIDKWDNLNPIYERSLTSFSELILGMFEKPTKINEAINEFLDAFEIKNENQKEELKKIGQEIIEASFESGVLLRSHKN